MIPKIVHQTWKTHTVPEHWRESEQSWRALEKHGWTYILWDDDEIDAFIARDYPWFIAQFRGYRRGISRADAVRPFLLHKYGGVYVDLDIVAKPDDFLRFYEMTKDQRVLLPRTKSGNGVDGHDLTNCFMMSAPGDPFWEVVWRRLQAPFKDQPAKRAVASVLPYFNTIFSTGPGVICDAYAAYPQRKKIYVIPSELTQPGSDSRPKPHQETNSIVKVIEGSSWHQADAKVVMAGRWVLNHSQACLGVLSAALLVTVIGLSVAVHQRRKL